MATILEQIEQAAGAETDIPAGYQRIVMSEQGKYGAPAVLHIRNFTVQEALELGSISQEELPIKVPNLLQKIIYEPDVKIADFYENEVAELLIKFYINFYSRTLPEVTYTPTDTDKEWILKNIYKGKNCPEYQNWLRGVENGKLQFHYSIDLLSVRYYQIPKDVHTKIKMRKGDFSVVFSYPRFGDSAIIQKAVNEKFRVKDKQFGPLYETYKRKQDAEERLRKGENVAIDQIPYLDPDDLQAVRAYELEKTAYILSMMKGLYLRKINDEDVSELPLSERVKLAEDYRIDYSSFQMVSENFSKMEIGPVGKVKIENPVTGVVEEIDHPFRPLELLASIRHYKSDETSIEFE